MQRSRSKRVLKGARWKSADEFEWRTMLRRDSHTWSTAGSWQSWRDGRDQDGGRWGISSRLLSAFCDSFLRALGRRTVICGRRRAKAASIAGTSTRTSYASVGQPALRYTPARALGIARGHRCRNHHGRHRMRPVAMATSEERKPRTANSDFAE